MRRLKVQITESTLAKIREQVHFIAEDSIENALVWKDRLLAAIEGLGDFHGHAIDEEACARIVEVVNFRHGARQPRVGEP